jgi:hypothetical protein
MYQTNGWREFYKENPEKGSICDLIARKTIIEKLPLYIKDIWYIEEDPFGKYDIDLVATRKNGSIFYIEAELRLIENYTSSSPFQCPSRKEKYFVNREDTMYIQINGPQTLMTLVDGDILMSSPKKMYPNRFNPYEFFYRPSQDGVTQFIIDPLDEFAEVNWRTLNQRS